MTDNKQETKRQAFQRIRDIRLPKILKSVKLLGNLSRKNQYEYSSNEAFLLVSSITKEVNAIAKKFGVETGQQQAESHISTQKRIDKQLSKKDLTTDARADIQWGYEMLCRGDTNEAVTMIERGLRR
jgi:hypothetical protein|tara:strand:+ start:165 stop:545 length:381 start_codon:yes stop_codon:yes gene_type:complete